MTDGTQSPRDLVGLWELPDGSVQHVSKGCGRLWPWDLQLHARATWRDFDSTGCHQVSWQRLLLKNPRIPRCCCPLDTRSVPSKVVLVCDYGSIVGRETLG
ncbi:hypothetical protein VULLAG_LOCUS23483 [Vulpes lagopus]